MLKTLLIVTTLLISPMTATAQQANCAPYDKIVSVLTDRYGQSRLFSGKSVSGLTQIMLFVNPVTGTWTAVSVDIGTGSACIVADGDETVVYPLGEQT